MTLLVYSHRSRFDLKLSVHPQNVFITIYFLYTCWLLIPTPPQTENYSVSFVFSFPYDTHCTAQLIYSRVCFTSISLLSPWGQEVPCKNIPPLHVWIFFISLLLILNLYCFISNVYFISETGQAALSNSPTGLDRVIFFIC